MSKLEWTKDSLKCAIAFVLIPLVAALVLGAVWAMVDWLRAYGTGASVLPYFDHAYIQAEPFRRQTAGTLPGLIEDVINWYNLNFLGATRFGSGLGLIAGAFIAMGLFKDKDLALRVLSGALAGATIGARSVLMLGSGVPLFLVGFFTGAIIGAAYMAFGAGAPNVAALPPETLPGVS